MNHNFFIPLVKIDVERRLVIGRAAQETADRSKEIMDYATAKPAFQEWSKSFEDATGGLSKGNVRIMHTKDVAGKVVDISFNDAEKAVDVMTKIVDEVAWQKCLEGCYTGFSMGGGYANSWQDGDLKRYTPRISEISLVDMPCIPTAKFAELVKADGMSEQLELKGSRPIPPTFGELRKNAPLSYNELREHPEIEPEFMSYSDLRKFDETRHPREKGKFKRVYSLGRGIGSIAASIAGGEIGGKIADKTTAAPFNRLMEAGNFEHAVGTRLAGRLAGGLVGGYIGYRAVRPKKSWVSND